MSVEVLKFGSSVLKTPNELHLAVDEIYRHWRLGSRVLAVVSAFEGVTDRLTRDINDALGTPNAEAVAAYVATGEQQTAALLQGSLVQYGVPARVVQPSEIRLIAEGEPLESTPKSVDVGALERLWQLYPILVLPGFYGVDGDGRTVLLGRGGSDMSALFLAAALGASCRLLKDVPGVFNADPAASLGARRYSHLSWQRAIEVAGPLIQPKALHYAASRTLPFEVGRPSGAACTHVGQPKDQWDSSVPAATPINVALLGCGVVGRGVYEALLRYRSTFAIRHVVVRDVQRHLDVKGLTTDCSVVIDDAIDVVIVCIPGNRMAYPLISAALSAGKYVITPNKAAVAAHGKALAPYTRGSGRRLWYSAAVGGAVPALETIAARGAPIREVRGIVNATSSVVLDALARGKTLEQAIAEAQRQGFTELDPTTDLSGQDSADKLSLLIEAAFGEWLAPESIETSGIERINPGQQDYRLIARARMEAGRIRARVSPEQLPPGSFLSRARGPENRLEIELADGKVVRLRGQGAGRWPTTASIMGDLHEIARILDSERHCVSVPIAAGL